jgi:hypothetical protein
MEFCLAGDAPMPVQTEELLATQADEGLQWQRLCLLSGQFEANCRALATRMPELAARVMAFSPTADWMLAIKGNQVLIADHSDGAVRMRPCLLSAAAAHQTLERLFPDGKYTQPLLVAGVDQGWLWQQAYSMPSLAPAVPGHQLPLYFVTRELEEFRIALHLHDWREMLADGRVRLMVGEDAVEQFMRSLAEHPRIATPKIALTLGAPLWPAGTDLGSVIAQARVPLEEEVRALMGQYAETYAGLTPRTIAARFRSGEKLRVLGITSRYTTFLQYSMRDWLAAFERMGHTTRLLIEGAAYEQMTGLCFARACAEFRPDLIVLIDHYRGEFKTLPTQVPCVMWVQDKLPTIFRQTAGEAQGPLDYCLGFGRLLLSQRFGYPPDRYMEATVGVDEVRFAPGRGEGRGRFACDVSFVSHASTPADALMTPQLAKAGSPQARRLLTEMFDRLRAIYESGGMVYHRLSFQKMLDEASASAGMVLEAQSREEVIDLFSQQINNALFRHQTLEWLAETDVDLHLYGKGWENHPRLKRFARGVADNQRQLTEIFQTSRINLQVTPHGAVHQRLFEGLASGGFFLIRHTPGELVENYYKPIWEWCRATGIESDDQLLARATPEVTAALAELERLLGFSPFAFGSPFMEVMRLSADAGFTRSAGSIWPEYGEVAFSSRGELQGRVRRFLADDAERGRLAASMRQAVLDRFTYQSTTRRLLAFIADELGNRSEREAA